MTYLLWKCVHIAAVIVFLGNISTGLFWAAHAHRSRDPRLIASAFAGIERSDRWFTIPGVIGILVSGVAMAIDAGIPLLKTGWVFWPIVLFALSGVVFAIWIAPLQRRIVKMMTEVDAASWERIWPTYISMRKRWEWWGALALLTPIAAFVMMVLKPTLPAL